MFDIIMDFIVGTVYGGIITILVGVFCLYYIFYVSKTTYANESVFFPKWKGILGGLGLIVMGIVIIIKKVFYPEVE